VPAAPRRIDRRVASQLLTERPFDRARLAYRDVSAVGNRTTLIAAMVPPGVVTTHTLLCLKTPMADQQQLFLCGLFNSYVLNALVRCLIGGHVTTAVVEDLPVPAWRGDRLQRLVASLAGRLARAPSPADESRLQALVARVYGICRDDFAGILDSFPLVPRPQRDRALGMLDGNRAKRARAGG
jgi:hypothetical protein